MQKEYEKDFWKSPSLDDLAEAQHVKPIDDITKLYGTWPGEEDDGFEEMIKNTRQYPRQCLGISQSREL